MEETILNNANLGKINIDKPGYDRADLKTSILHIGVGGFHRSHQSYYLDKLMSQTQDTSWGIQGVGLREGDRNIDKALNSQDGMYTLIVKKPNGEINNKVIGTIDSHLLAVDKSSEVLAKMISEEIKIVSLTITEGGYNFNPATGEFNFENPDIIHDLANIDAPKTAFGYIVRALELRREKGIKPFTVVSCDNIQENGHVAAKMISAFAHKYNAELGAWIDENVAFPNSMVDRITPVTTKEDIQELKETTGIVDQWPVTCEPFIQWVIEDKFCNDRPALEKVGVQFVKDVAPYEKMKLRLLNAGHSVLGIIGSLLAFPTIDKSMTSPTLAKFMRGYMDKEVTPNLDALEGIDLTAYKDELEVRFGNPNIDDHLTRICSQSSAKIPVFVLPTLLDNLEKGTSIDFVSFLLASWCLYYMNQKDIQGNTLEIIDENEATLLEYAKATSVENPTAFLAYNEVFGALKDNEVFVAAYTKYINTILVGDVAYDVLFEAFVEENLAKA